MAILQSVLLELLVPLLFGSISGLLSIAYRRYRDAKKADTEEPSYSDKLKILSVELSKNASNLEDILNEFSLIVKERENQIVQLEAELEKLGISEREYKDRIAALKDVPIPAIDHLLKQLEPSERRSARRDYLLFFGGIFFGALVSIILSLTGITG